MTLSTNELKLISDCLVDSLILKNKQLQHDPRQAWYYQPQVDKITALLAKIDKQILTGK